MIEFAVVIADIMERPCDILVLKHAGRFHGLDGRVAERIGFNQSLRRGDYAVVPGNGIAARLVMFCGVGPLDDFRYERIRSFSAAALERAASASDSVRTICSTVHGPGYGLDEREAFLSLIGGFVDGIRNGRAPSSLRRIEIVETSEDRANRLLHLLEVTLINATQYNFAHQIKNPGSGDLFGLATVDAQLHQELSSFGAESERKPKLFVAMPFSDQFSDVWEVAIQDASHSAGILTERIAEQAYVGDVVTEIKKRVTASSGLLAVLDGANPNVFLELGYAWALNKPTVLISRSASELPFDVRGQKCIIYKNIGDLRKQLTDELSSLKALGMFNGAN